MSQMLPDGWQFVELGKVCGLPERQVRPSEFSKYDYYVGLEHIEGDTGRIIEYKKVPEANLKSSKFHFDASCILYGKLRPYLNKVALPTVTGLCSTDILPLKPFPNLISREFLYYFLRSPSFVKVATEKSTGANLPRIGPDVLLNIPIPLPPMNMQTKIAKTLARTDQLRKRREQANQLTNKIIQSVFLKMFGDPDANPMHWQTEKLGDLLMLSSGKTRPNGISDTPADRHVFPVFGGNGIIGYSERYLVEQPTIVIGRVGQYCGNVHVSSGRSWISDNALYCKEFLREDLNLQYLACCLILLRLNRLQKRSGQPLVTQGILSPLEIPLPPIELQTKFELIVESIRKVSERQRQNTQEINELFHSLMHKAFRGELRTAEITAKA